MSARTSQFIRLARLSARRNLESDPDRVRNRVLMAIMASEDKEEKRIAYSYKIDDHHRLDNKFNAYNSKGCGCVLCTTRHEYVRLKSERNIFQKSYERQIQSRCFHEVL